MQGLSMGTVLFDTLENGCQKEPSPFDNFKKNRPHLTPREYIDKKTRRIFRCGAFYFISGCHLEPSPLTLTFTAASGSPVTLTFLFTLAS